MPASFNVDVFEPMTYDFTGFPSNTGKGMCKGKGILPEPTQPLLEAYAEAVQSLFAAETAEAQEDTEKEMEEQLSSEEKSDKLLEFTAALCQQSPSAEELSELPPRIRNGFMKWAYKELSDPKV